MSNNSQKKEVTATPETKQTAENKTTVTTLVKVEPKEVPLVPPKREKAMMTIKDIIEKYAQQAKRIDKLERLNATHKNLDSFKLGSDRLKDTLSIVDGENNTFETHNSEIIAQVIELIKGEVLAKATETEKEIEANEI